VACPVNWQPGQEVIVPPPQTLEEADKRAKAGADRWYMMRKKI
jgi:peroxiredoxin (alkyl hydroperoxide reductase subunit C)